MNYTNKQHEIEAIKFQSTARHAAEAFWNRDFGKAEDILTRLLTWLRSHRVEVDK